MFSPPPLRSLKRLAAGLSAALLCFSLTADAFGLDPCPHHGVPESSAAAAPATPGKHAQHGMAHEALAHTALHAAQHGQSSNAPDKSKHDGHHGVCTCAAACDTVVAVTTPRADGPIFAVAIASDAAYHRETTTNRTSHTLDLLPYSIAPPAAYALV